MKDIEIGWMLCWIMVDRGKRMGRLIVCTIWLIAQQDVPALYKKSAKIVAA